MTTHSEVLYRDDARTRLLTGASKLAELVRGTLGPESRSVLLEQKWGAPLVSDDGVTIAKRLTLEDKFENLGAQMLREAAAQTGDAVGDGTTTSTILAHALFSEALRNVIVGDSAVGIRRGMELGLQRALEALATLSRPVKDRVDTAHVATVSAHNDPAIGDVVADAIERVGPEGVVEVEEARGTETELEVVEGMQLSNGYLSPYFVTDASRMEAVLEQPLILLVDHKLTTMIELLPLLESIVKAGRSLLVVAETVDGEALATLALNRVRGALAVAAVKAPGFGQRRREMLEDIAVLTGGQVASADLGVKLENLSIDALGEAEKVIVTKDTATIIGGSGAPEAVKGRCEQLRAQIEDTTSDWDREKLEERLAKLSGGVAVIRVGATSETALKRLKEAYDDAISSARAALVDGIVPGGGVALLRASRAVESAIHDADGPERTGLMVLRRALESPVRQIAQNAGVDPGPVVERIQNGEGFFGFDARTRTYVDLDEAGVIDPTKVVRIALEQAVSVASTLLLAEAALVDIEEPQPAPMAPDFG